MQALKIAFAVTVAAAPLALLPTCPSLAAGQPAPAASVGGRPLVDAPLSALGPTALPPVDRAAQPGTHSDSAGPVNGTPFSSTPSGTLSEGGTQPDQHDRSFAASNNSGVVPNLGK